jgi:hypothetical protein
VVATAAATWISTAVAQQLQKDSGSFDSNGGNYDSNGSSYDNEHATYCVLAVAFFVFLY